MPTLYHDVVDRLFAKMDELVPAAIYPSVVPRITERIEGTAFFPGGSGLFLEGRDRQDVQFPFGGVMVLGHNFDSESGFNKSFARKGEILATGTWGPLLKVLKEASIPFEQCFFTNAFMGLCEGDDSSDFAGRSNERFRNACLAFLKTQIEIQRPRLILTLGLHSPPLLACISSDLTSWKGRPQRSGFDRTLKPVRPQILHRVQFRGISG
jgi:hypothetical protein